VTTVSEAAARLGAQFEREIREQPEAIRRQIELGRSASEAIAAEIRRRAPHTLLITARGSSDNAGRYAQYVFGVHNRRLVGFAAPSLFTLYRAPPDLRGTLVLGVSQSGRSPDIVAVLEEARRQNVYTVAITRDPDSPLARAAEQCVLLHAGEEQAIAATKAYTCQLVALAMLSTALSDDPIRWRELQNLPDAVQRALDVSVGAAEQAARFRHAERFIVIGRGYNYATAFEISLKIQEASYAMAEPYSAADFWHGPAAMVDRGLPVLLVAPSGEPLGDITELRDLCVRRRADLIAISDHDEVLAHAAARLPLPSGVREWLSPVTAVVPGQLFALHLARARGLDPDQPRGLRKVTETR
jgi:glucosamine--fructose-6-phosphate aminotransferase (isomerizing)